LTALNDRGARVLLFSMRNLNQHVSSCQRYEFEDVIAAAGNADILAPVRPPKRTERRIVRYTKKILRQRNPLLDGEIHLARDYDLFVAMCRRPRDLRYIEYIDGLAEKCRLTVCLLDETWPDDVSRSSHSDLERLRRFDYVFVNVEAGVGPLSQWTKRQPHYMPYGVDALTFCPYPDGPDRCIDVLCMGRRTEELHGALLDRARRAGEFYIYDTVSNFSVMNPGEHRRLLSNMIKRSRYFIAYPGRFTQDVPQFLLGNRYFEGAAGGATLLGMGPANTPFEKYFDWPDAVYPTPMDGSQISDLIDDLDQDPTRLNQVRQNGVVNCLRRHDWVYRWREILEAAGLSVSEGVLKREQQLNDLADLVGNEAVEH
jgi:hypothetical protein